jgi:2-amino-4-hydroxy-6-hydroxymethyldihydropteridine diphosphokinase
MIAHIGLGSNLNNPKKQIHDALVALNSQNDVEVIGLSSLYESPPIDNSNQPNYLNAVAKINTHLSPLELLRVCQHIENSQHRVREKKWGARTIDLDIILYGVQVIASPELMIPHQEMMNRAFVLVPLAELEPDLKVPILGDIQMLIEELGAENIANIKKIT